MSYIEEFPGFELDVIIPSGFKDCSWNKEPCPSWGKELEDGGVIRLIIDYPIASYRDYPGNSRFHCQYWMDGENDEMPLAVVHSDNWNHILNWIKFMEIWGGWFCRRSLSV
ncbi:hypothetical protein O4H49_20455 [Kiloniella laminariae]|uniref:Uncharacterized protein n=1 Tax=Kiloniella laminariae TaxID=454162 RepID=A0ABT4LQ50_9PROT|nr:hypothetical protein [Kiloniella laminariae]MCZ4283161.1 hypothetical protein [Kiloniella laminariae]